MRICMNWQRMNFDWNQVRAFLATVEEGSLSGAARALGLTQPTLGRQVTGLEQDLGVVLFERTGRTLTLTQSGAELLDHVRAMGEAANRISLAASGQAQSIDGEVRITASDMMSAYHLPPIIAELRRQAPLLQIELIAANDIRDLLRREADIAIRHVRPEQPDLIARLVSEGTGRFYASHTYLKNNGEPKTIAELANHDFIGFGDTERMLGHLNPAGIPVTADNFLVGSASGIVAWELARQGLGIAVMSDQLAKLYSDMVPLLPDMEPFRFPIWLATHRELHTSRRIRLVFDHLAEAFS